MFCCLPAENCLDFVEDIDKNQEARSFGPELHEIGKVKKQKDSITTDNSCN